MLTAAYILIFGAMVAERFNGSIDSPAQRRISPTPQISETPKMIASVVLKADGKYQGPAKLQSTPAEPADNAKPQLRGDYPSAVEMAPSAGLDPKNIAASKAPKAEVSARLVPSVVDPKDQNAARAARAAGSTAVPSAAKSEVATRVVPSVADAEGPECDSGQSERASGSGCR